MDPLPGSLYTSSAMNQSASVLPAAGNRLLRSTVRGLAAVLLAFPGADAASQTLPPGGEDGTASASTEPGSFRVGVTFAGTSLAGLVLEHQWGDRSAELTVGTVSFRDVSLSLVGKQYFSGGSLRPFAGVGLWTMVSFHEERNGVALIFRAPVGADWRISGGHVLGSEMNLNRALIVRRVDPADDRPPNSRIVPIPAIFYRYRLDP